MRNNEKQKRFGFDFWLQAEVAAQPNEAIEPSTANARTAAGIAPRRIKSVFERVNVIPNIINSVQTTGNSCKICKIYIRTEIHVNLHPYSHK